MSQAPLPDSLRRPPSPQPGRQFALAATFGAVERVGFKERSLASQAPPPSAGVCLDARFDLVIEAAAAAAVCSYSVMFCSNISMVHFFFAVSIFCSVACILQTDNSC